MPSSESDKILSQDTVSAECESVGDGIILVDSFGRVAFVNNIAESLTGWTYSEALGKPLSEIFRIIDSKTGLTIDPSCYRGTRHDESPLPDQFSILLSREGEQCPISHRASAIRQADGDSNGCVIAFRRIPPAHDSGLVQGRLAAIVQSSEDAIIAYSLDGMLTEWNTGAEQLFGYRADEVLGRSIFVTIIPPEAADELREILIRVGHGDRSPPFESVRCDKRGRRFDASIGVSVVRDELGQAVGASEITRDISQAKRKDEFLAMLAHELRNPLAPIQSGLDLLALDKTVSEEMVELMKHQVENLVRLVDDLLDMSRILQGKVRLRKETVEVAQLVRRSVEGVRFFVQRRQQELLISVPPETLLVSADPIRMIQVLGNLLNNASKFTGQGGRIELSVKREGNVVTIRVRDNGMGITRHMLTKVFDLFTQGASAIDRSEGGLGIGLTMVKSLVELHGGRVVAASDGLGKGSTFTVSLPLVERPNRIDAAESPKEAVPRRRVLVVDDNIGAARMLSLLLSRLGASEVKMAHDGNATIATASEFVPEIIFLDIGLPGMNGFETARRLRSMPQFDNTLLVAVTGYGQDEDRRQSREAGFDEHLVKPVDIASLRKMFAHPKLPAAVAAGPR